MATRTMSAQRARQRTMLIPREHGAWGMLLVPLTSGAAVAFRSGLQVGALALFVVATLALFWLRTPVEAWLGLSPIKAQNKEERASVLRLILMLCVIAVASLAALFATGYARGLFIIGSVAVFAFGAQELVKKLGRSGRMPAQIIGAIGLTSTAAGAYYINCQSFNKTAVLLWVANWLFAANQIQFVQTRIRGARLHTMREKLDRGKWFAGSQLALLILLLIGSRYGVLPAWTLIAFVPVLARGVGWFVCPTQPLDVHRLGFSELSQAIVFGALLSAAFLV